MCWDSRASADDVHLWVARTIANPHGGAPHLLTEVGDPRAGAALREYVASGDLRVLALVVCALGWSGDDTDAVLLVPGASDHLAALLDELDPDGDAKEVRHVQICRVTCLRLARRPELAAGVSVVRSWRLRTKGLTGCRVGPVLSQHRVHELVRPPALEHCAAYQMRLLAHPQTDCQPR
jgi:hypothetical protein